MPIAASSRPRPADSQRARCRHFLHNVVTCNVNTLAAGGARYGALLMPQGKIISDFLIYAPSATPDTSCWMPPPPWRRTC